MAALCYSPVLGGLLAAALALTALPAFARGQQQEPPPAAGEPTAAPSDERALAAFAALAPAERREVLDWLGMELERCGSLQSALLARLARREAGRPEDLPPPPAARHFDPRVHAPAQPIPRAALAEGDPRLEAARRRLLPATTAAQPPRAYTYDSAARALRREAWAADPLRVFHDALRGLPPLWDLSEARIERDLDDGSLQKSFQAFAHAYTDRAGGVYGGVTLFDAWAARSEIEMPDVDCLGIVHLVLGDWKTWKAPVPSSSHAALYQRIGELFQEARRFRTLRQALARTWLAGRPLLEGGWEGSLDNLHALWEHSGSEPAELLARLPRPAEQAGFLADFVKRCHAEPELFQAGVRRREALERGAQTVRATLLRVLEEFGAFRRLDEQAPKGG